MSCCKTKCNKRGEQGPPGPRGPRGISSSSIGSTIIPYAASENGITISIDASGSSTNYNNIGFGSTTQVPDLNNPNNPYFSLGFRAPRNGTLKSLYGFFRPNGELETSGDVTITMGIYETVPTGAQILTQIASVDFDKYLDGKSYMGADYRVAETDSLNIPIVKGNIYTCFVYATADNNPVYPNAFTGYFSGGMTI